MNEYEVVVELDDIGHLAKAVSSDGEVLAVAHGFGARDAKRQLKAKMFGKAEPKKVLVKSTKKKPKIHKPAGVIFTAKNRIERANEKRVESKNDKFTKGSR